MNFSSPTILTIFIIVTDTHDFFYQILKFNTQNFYLFFNIYKSMAINQMFLASCCKLYVGR